jgi:hypothetical protein
MYDVSKVTPDISKAHVITSNGKGSIAAQPVFQQKHWHV